MLDRWLKPRTENPDPQVRKQAFAEVDPEHPCFKEAVRFDADAGVRISLLGRLRDLSLLALRCGEEDDDTARSAARERLCELLCGAADTPDLQSRLAQIGRLGQADILERVVRNADDARVRDAALSGLLSDSSDWKALLVAVASEDSDADLRTRAVDRLNDPEALDAVAVNVRKSDKDLHRRARDRIRAIRDNEEREDTRRQLIRDVLELAARPLEAQSDSLHRRQARLHHWRDGWKHLQLGESAVPAEVAQALVTIEENIAAARETVTARRAMIDEIGTQDPASGEHEAIVARWRARWGDLDDHREDDHNALDRALTDFGRRRRDWQRLSAAQTDAITLLGEWEATDWDKTVVDEKKRRQLEKYWGRIALPTGETEEALHKRYAALCDRLRDAQGRQESASKTAADEASQLVDELASHLDAGRSAEATSAHDKVNHRLNHGVGLPPARAARIRKRLADLGPELRKLKEWRHWGADQARESLCAEAEALVGVASERQASKLAAGVKTLREKWQKIDKGVGAAPAKLWQRFDGACEQAYAPAKKVFEEQSEERRENAKKKRALCARIEAYTNDSDWTQPDWAAATRLLDECRREWHKIGGVHPRQFGKLRDRYRRARAGLDSHLDDERQRELRRRQLAIAALKKDSEREPLESLIEAAKKLQREWRPTVQCRRKEEQELWQSLREVCDAIFARRDERFANRREEESKGREVRDALCTQIEALLIGDDHDEAAVNQSAGRFDQIRREWREAGSVAPRQKTALERRYRQVCRDFEVRRDRLRKREHGRHSTTLVQRALIVDEMRQRLGTDSTAAIDDLRCQWDGLPAARGAFARSLDAAFAKDVADGEATAANLVAKKNLCLRIELLSDVPSPDECQGERMALKIALLKDSLSGGRVQDREKVLPDLLAEWYGCAPVSADDWAALRQRFEHAALALIGGS